METEGSEPERAEVSEPALMMSPCSRSGGTDDIRGLLEHRCAGTGQYRLGLPQADTYTFRTRQPSTILMSMELTVAPMTFWCTPSRSRPLQRWPILLPSTTSIRGQPLLPVPTHRRRRQALITQRRKSCGPTRRDRRDSSVLQCSHWMGQSRFYRGQLQYGDAGCIDLGEWAGEGNRPGDAGNGGIIAGPAELSNIISRGVRRVRAGIRNPRPMSTTTMMWLTLGTTMADFIVSPGSSRGCRLCNSAIYARVHVGGAFTTSPVYISSEQASIAAMKNTA